MKVQVGQAFDSLKVAEEMKQNADLIAASTNNNESRTRTHLAYGTATVGTAFLVSAAGIGLYDGSYNELQVVWMVSGPMIGAVLGYYFGGSGKKNQNDQSTN